MTEGEQFSLIPEFDKAAREEEATRRAKKQQEEEDKEREEKMIQETLTRSEWDHLSGKEPLDSGEINLEPENSAGMVSLGAVEGSQKKEEISESGPETKPEARIEEPDSPWEDINAPITNEIMKSRKKRKRLI